MSLSYIFYSYIYLYFPSTCTFVVFTFTSNSFCVFKRLVCVCVCPTIRNYFNSLIYSVIYSCPFVLFFLLRIFFSSLFSFFLLLRFIHLTSLLASHYIGKFFASARVYEFICLGAIKYAHFVTYMRALTMGRLLNSRLMIPIWIISRTGCFRSPRFPFVIFQIHITKT